MLDGVAFPDAAHGWVVGSNGTIFATTNGGASWVPQNSGHWAWLRAVAFSDAAHGWAVGDWRDENYDNHGIILATTNGGATWRAQYTGTGWGIWGVDFPDATHGWAVGGAPIFATANGGATWSPQDSGAEYWTAWGVAFADATHGWVVGSDGVILATATGGLRPVPKAPHIVKIKPASAKRGALVTISGTDFGTPRGSSAVRFGQVKCTTYVSWSAAQIRCRVPARSPYGALTVCVTTAAGTSNRPGFTVKR